MEIRPLEHIGKYFCMFVNKNQSVLTTDYNENLEQYLEDNISYPAYCYIMFMHHFSKITDQPEEIQLSIVHNTIEDLLKQTPIK